MTLKSAAWAIDGVDQEAEDFRNLLTALLGGVPGSDWVGGTSVSDAAHGVVHPSGLVVTEKSGTPDKSVDVAAGAVIVRGTENADQGAYFTYNDDVVNLPISEPDGANPRIDLVVVKVLDQEYGIAVTDGASLAIVTGTPGAIPVAPTVPDNALVLARINVDAAAASIVDADIDDLRTFTALPIGRCTFANLPDAPYKGQRVHVTDRGYDMIYYGATTGWTRPWGEAWGYVDESLTTAAGITTSSTTETLLKTSDSFTPGANRRCRVEFQSTAEMPTAGDVFTLRLRHNSAAGTILRSERISCPTSAPQQHVTLLGIFTAAAGANTIRYSAQRVAGTGVLGTLAGMDHAFYIEDIGPAVTAPPAD